LSRRKTLYLLFNAPCHVDRSSVGDMTISPQRMFPFRRSGRVEQAGLDNDHKRPLRYFAPGGGTLRPGYFFHGPPNVKSTCTPALPCSPGDGRTQGVIQFENTGTVPVIPKLLLEPARQPTACHLKRLPGRDIQEHEIRGKGIDRFDTLSGHDPPTQVTQMLCQGIAYFLGAAPRQRPTHSMCEDPENQPEGGADEGIQRHIECAAIPAKSARDRCYRKTRVASHRAGSSARMSNRANTNGWPGMRKAGRRIIGRSSFHRRASGFINRL
jgi:hypothetical protein